MNEAINTHVGFDLVKDGRVVGFTTATTIKAVGCIPEGVAVFPVLAPAIHGAFAKGTSL